MVMDRHYSSVNENRGLFWRGLHAVGPRVVAATHGHVEGSHCPRSIANRIPVPMGDVSRIDAYARSNGRRHAEAHYVRILAGTSHSFVRGGWRREEVAERSRTESIQDLLSFHFLETPGGRALGSRSCVRAPIDRGFRVRAGHFRPMAAAIRAAKTASNQRLSPTGNVNHRESLRFQSKSIVIDEGQHGRVPPNRFYLKNQRLRNLPSAIVALGFPRATARGDMVNTANIDGPLITRPKHTSSREDPAILGINRFMLSTLKLTVSKVRCCSTRDALQI